MLWLLGRPKPMLTETEIRQARDGLVAILAAVDAGEITATADQRANLDGALSTLELLAR
jgi:hypothetical protein